MVSNVYNLPQIEFVAGENKSFLFRMYTKQHFPYDGKGCSVNYSIINYSDKSGPTILSKSGIMIMDQSGIYSTAKVELQPMETVNLFGKFVYQISVRDVDKKIEIPGQGILLITRNINRGFIVS